MMHNLNYQKYLNNSFKFDALLWKEFKKFRKTLKRRIAVSPSGRLTCACSYLDWDTKVLGVTAARIENVFFKSPEDKKEFPGFLRQVESLLKADAQKLLFFRFDPNHFDIWQDLEKSGWKTVDVMNIYFAKLPLKTEKCSVRQDAGLSFSDFSLKEAADFFARAKDVFVYSRIYNDKQLAVEKARLFYRRLFEALCVKPTTIKIGLYKGKRLIGITLGEQDELLNDSAGFKLGYLWEIAIDPDFRRRGYSKLLFQQFLRVISKKVDYLEVGTQVNNIAANRLYSSGGLAQAANAVTLHKWLK